MAAAAAERPRLFGVALPPLGTVLPPVLLLFATYDPENKLAFTRNVALLAVGLLVSSVLTEKLENSEWRQRLRAEAHARSESEATPDQASAKKKD